MRVARNSAPIHAAQEVLDYWFGQRELDGAALQERMGFWFGRDDEEQQRELQQLRDDSVHQRFGAVAGRAALGELDHWASSPHRLLALILLLDQIPRQIHRGTAAAFAQDSRALHFSIAGMQHGADATLGLAQRMFFYMPMQHAEDRDAQDESVAAFTRLAAEAPPEVKALFEQAREYAQLHRDIIERFGRFPHRNEALGRVSTVAELEWLRTGERFGQ